MKKETIITALIFLAVGFLAGYITDYQVNWASRQKSASVAGADSPPPSADSASPNDAGGNMSKQRLPEGHPPIDNAAMIQQMEEIARQNPKDLDTRLKIANFFYDQKAYSKSIEWYERALELDPTNVNARTDLGTAYFYTGRPQDALREYDKSLQINPQHEPTLLNAIVVNLEGTHDLAAAQKDWDKLHQLDPSHPALASLQEQINAARGAGSSKTGTTSN